MAVHKWRTYRTTVTKDRLKMYALIAWLASYVTISPPVIIQAASVSYVVA